LVKLKKEQNKNIVNNAFCYLHVVYIQMTGIIECACVVSINYQKR